MTKNNVTPPLKIGKFRPINPQSPNVSWNVCPITTDRAAIALNPFKPVR